MFLWLSDDIFQQLFCILLEYIYLSQFFGLKLSKFDPMGVFAVEARHRASNTELLLKGDSVSGLYPSKLKHKKQ